MISWLHDRVSKVVGRKQRPRTNPVFGLGTGDGRAILIEDDSNINTLLPHHPLLVLLLLIIRAIY